MATPRIRIYARDLFAVDAGAVSRDEPRLQSRCGHDWRPPVRAARRGTIRAEDFGPFVEYALCGETLGNIIARANAAQPLHSSDVDLDLRIVGDEARWRVRYRAKSEPTVEHHAQRSLMQMLGMVSRFAGARGEGLEIHLAEPYAEEARLLENRLDIPVRPRGSDYEIAFPASLLGRGTPIAGLPRGLLDEAAAGYRDRPLPRAMAEAVLVALQLHEDLPRAGIGVTAAEFGLPARTLQHALKTEGVSYRDIVLRLRMKRARQLLATTQRPLRRNRAARWLFQHREFSSRVCFTSGMTPGVSARRRERDDCGAERAQCMPRCSDDRLGST